MYNVRLARTTLEALAKAFPHEPHLQELQADLPRFQSVPADEWRLVVEALRLDGAPVSSDRLQSTTQ